MIRAAFLALLLGCLSAPAFAQTAEPVGQSDGYSVAGYLAARAEMSRADAALAATEPGTDANRSATVALAHQVNSVIGYLNAWFASGTMPDDVYAEAESQRFVLFENLVSLYADTGDCLASRTALESMRALDRTGGPEVGDLIASADQIVAGCVQRSWRTTYEVPPGMSPRVGRGIWGGGLAVTAIGGVVALAARDSRSDYREVVERQVADATVETELRRQVLEREVDRSRRAATTLVCMGTVLVATGITLELVSRDRRAALSASVGSSGGGVRVAWGGRKNKTPPTEGP